MVKYFTILLLFLGVSEISFAQKYDIGINGGGTVYMGELNQREFYNFNRGGLGLTLRKNLNPDFSVKLALNQLLLHGSDIGTGDPNRDLFATTWVSEASLQFEFNFFKFNPFDKRESYSPYVFVGGGAFHFNPYTFYNGQKIFLNSIGTEGQNATGAARLPAYQKPYNLNSICIPIGFGFKYHLAGHFSLTAEYGIRLTFTDYLDDVSGLYPDYNALGGYVAKLSNRGPVQNQVGDQRGDSWQYDKYFYGSIGIIYTFRSVDCPKFN